MAGGVGEGIEAEKTGATTGYDVGCSLGVLDGHILSDGVVDRSDHVAEDAVTGFGGDAWAGPGVKLGGNARAEGFFCAGNILITPGGPKTIHEPEYRAFGRVAITD